MEPKWSQDEAKRGQDGQRGAKRGQDGAKMGPRRNQHGAKVEVQKTLKKKLFWAPSRGAKQAVFRRLFTFFDPKRVLKITKILENNSI